MREKLLLGILIISSLLVSTFLVTALVSNQNNAETSKIENQNSLKIIPANELDDEDSEEQITSEELSKIEDQITKEQAVSIANDAVKDKDIGKITDIELEKENSKVVYAIEYTKNGIETDVKIDPITGKVVKIESDLDEDEED